MYHNFNKRQVIAENPDGTSETMYANGKIAKEKIENMLILSEVEKHYILSSKGEK